jgi:phosphohistidine phosphatase
MDFYIVRHGVAEERGPDWPDDRRRPLTADGKTRTREVAAALRALAICPDAIFTSPLVRARQTAEIIARELGLGRRVRELSQLEPGTTAAALFEAIREAAPSADSVMVVGHEPDLGLLASRLVAGDGRAVDIPFKKAGLARIELDAMPPERRGTFRWLLTPSQLRAIGKSRRARGN